MAAGFRMIYGCLDDSFLALSAVVVIISPTISWRAAGRESGKIGSYIAIIKSMKPRELHPFHGYAVFSFVVYADKYA
jgi:hypothetical protein